MSGDLEDPSKSIPKGTLWAVGSTFCVYTCIVILMGGSISRSTMYTDLSVLQDVCSKQFANLDPLYVSECLTFHAPNADAYYFCDQNRVGICLSIVHCFRSTRSVRFCNVGQCYRRGQNSAGNCSRQLAPSSRGLWSGNTQDR